MSDHYPGGYYGAGTTRRIPDRVQEGFKLVASGLTYCLAHPDEAAEAGYDLARVEKMFMKIG